MDEHPNDIELLSNSEKVETFDVTRSRRSGGNLLVLGSITLAAVAGFWLLSGQGDDAADDANALSEPAALVDNTGNGDTTSSTDGVTEEPPPPPVPDRLDAALSTQGIPDALLAAEIYHAAPSAESLRHLFRVLGGFDGLLTASAEGAFDLVRFDPLDPYRVIASVRSSYGEASNEQLNQVWHVGPSNVDQELWAANTPHDYGHFNVDGSITMWVNEGSADFSPRTATVHDNNMDPLFTTDPLFASRFTATTSTVFALTGDGDYYSNNRAYVDLVADQGDGPIVLADGSIYGWIDNPSAEILVAYPAAGADVTAVWDTATLESLPSHPLAGRDYIRSAISEDGSTAIGVSADGVMHVIDMANGEITNSFAEVDVDRVDVPVTLSDDGTVAWTVENNGQLTVWWVGDSQAIGAVTTFAGQPRWVSEQYSPTTTTVVAPGGRHAVLRIGPSLSTPGTWLFADTDIDSWLVRACERDGQTLATDDAERLGLNPTDLACQR